jgi:hypothetical protein
VFTYPGRGGNIILEGGRVWIKANLYNPVDYKIMGWIMPDSSCFCSSFEKQYGNR